MSETTATRPVGVDELRRAWHALQDGQFRTRAPRPPQAPSARRPEVPASAWKPTEPVLPVIGCVGQAGATTAAVALATVVGAARVLECCTATSSGLTAAPTAELGRSEHNWTVGRRERVWLARSSEVLLDPSETPLPDSPPTGTELTVLDVGWDLGQVLAGDSWLRDQVTAAPTVIAVTTPTIPGLRRLELALTMLTPARVVVALIGSHPRRWPRPVTASLGPLTATALKANLLVDLPSDKGLALRGLDSSPLPTSLLKAAENLLQQAAAGDQHQKGQHE